MLAVCVKNPERGYEEVYEAIKVEAGSENSNIVIDKVNIISPHEKEIITVYGCDVFVMCEGKTVAKYLLASNSGPHCGKAVDVGSFSERPATAVVGSV